MRTRTRNTLAVLSLAAIAATGAAYSAHGLQGGHRGPRPMRMLKHLAEDPAVQGRLGLDAGQVARLREIRTDALTGITQLRADVSARRIEMRSLLLDERTPRSALEAKAAEIARARAAVAHDALEALLDARDVLSPDQRIKLRDAIADHEHGRGGARRGPNGPGGPETESGPDGGAEADQD